MSINIREAEMQHAKLFGHSVLYTNWLIDRNTVPDGWYCYDLRGTDKSPTKAAMLVEQADFHHVGTVLSPVLLKRKSSEYRRINRQFCLLGELMDLEHFCEEHDIEYPADNRKYIPRPASPDEAGLFYALPPEQDEELGAIGHVRMDFGRSGTKFWHTWHPRGPEELNSPAFKAELTEVVDELRKSVLKNFSAMTGYCRDHGGEISGGWVQNYGYIIETENYRYCLRCNPVHGDYAAYLSAYDLRVQRQNMTQSENQVVGRVSDDILFDLYGEENPRPLEDYENTSGQGMTLGGI